MLRHTSHVNPSLSHISEVNIMFYESLTRFERARIMSARALQVSMGAPILIKTSEHDPKIVALLEFEKGVLPITVKRPALPN